LDQAQGSKTPRLTTTVHRHAGSFTFSAEWTNCGANTVNGKTEFWGNTYTYDAWGSLLNKTKIGTAYAGENLSLTGRRAQLDPRHRRFRLPVRRGRQHDL
jgi:hypothetical protein